MIASQLAIAPACASTCRLCISIEPRVLIQRATYVRARQLFGGGILAPHRFLEVSKWRWPEPRQHPTQVGLIGHAPDLGDELFPRRRREARKEPTVPFRRHQPLHGWPPVGWNNVPHGLAVFWHEGIDVD